MKLYLPARRIGIFSLSYGFIFDQIQVLVNKPDYLYVSYALINYIMCGTHTCIYPYTDILHITPEIFKYDNVLLLKQTDPDVLELLKKNNVKHSFMPFNIPQYVSILEEVRKDISINEKQGVLHLEQYINYVESENKEDINNLLNIYRHINLLVYIIL